jgi:hypothetical protein
MLEDTGKNNLKKAGRLGYPLRNGIPFENKTTALPLHNPGRCSDRLWPDLESMTVVISVTEAQLTCLFEELLKQHKRLEN